MRATRSSFPFTWLGRVIAALLLLTPILAHADAERAEDSFDRGREAMLRGDYATACPLLAESHRREPRLGVLFTLAECEWRWGKAAHAVAHYDAFLRAYAKNDAPRAAANDERQRIALARRTALASRVGFVTLLAPVSNPPARVLVNDETIAIDDLGVELAVDPGVVRITSDGQPAIVITLAPSEHRTIALAAPALVAPLPSPPIAQTTREPSPGPPRAALSPLAYGAGAVGLGAAGVGVVTGVLVIGKKKAIDAHCPDHRCDPQGLADVDSARTLGRTSTIAFIVGAAGLTTATILFMTHRRSTPWPAQVGVGTSSSGLGAFLTGTW